MAFSVFMIDRYDIITGIGWILIMALLWLVDPMAFGFGLGVTFLIVGAAGAYFRGPRGGENG